MRSFTEFVMEGSFSEDIKKAVWLKGKIATTVQNRESSSSRFDVVGAIMYEEEYGNRNSEFGWEIDHIDNKRENNDISNLRPLFWKNNTARNQKKEYEFYAFDEKKQDNSRIVTRNRDI